MIEQEIRGPGNRQKIIYKYIEFKKSREHKVIEGWHNLLNKLRETCILLGNSIKSVWRDSRGSAIIFSSNGDDFPLSGSFDDESNRKIAKQHQQDLKDLKKANYEKKTLENNKILGPGDELHKNEKEKYPNEVDLVFFVHPKANKYEMIDGREEIIGHDYTFIKKKNYLAIWEKARRAGEDGNQALKDEGYDNIKIYTEKELGIDHSEAEKKLDSDLKSRISEKSQSQIDLKSKKIVKPKKKQYKPNLPFIRCLKTNDDYTYVAISRHRSQEVPVKSYNAKNENRQNLSPSMDIDDCNTKNANLANGDYTNPTNNYSSHNQEDDQVNRKSPIDSINHDPSSELNHKNTPSPFPATKEVQNNDFNSKCDSVNDSRVSIQFVPGKRTDSFSIFNTMSEAMSLKQGWR